MFNDAKPGFRIAVAAALLAVALAACAGLRWQKAGASAETLKEDLDQCRRESRLQVAREAFPRFTLAPVIATDQRGRTVWVQPHPHDTERFLLEHDVTRWCMHKKSYELVPEPPASTRN